MLGVIYNLLNFDLKLMYDNNWNISEFEEMDLLKDVYKMFRKYGLIDVFDYLNTFVENLKQLTNKNWQLLQDNGYKIVCEDGKQIKVNGKLDFLKTNVDGVSSINYYLPCEVFEDLKYITYKQLFEENVLQNETEILNDLTALKTCYSGLLVKLKNDIENLKREFSKNHKTDKEVIDYIAEQEKSYQTNELKQKLSSILVKYEYDFLRDGILGEYSPQSFIKTCGKLLNNLSKPDYTVYLVDYDNILKIGGLKLGILFGFKVDETTNQAVVSGSVDLHNKAKKILNLMANIVSKNGNSREQLLDPNFVHNVEKMKKLLLNASYMLQDFEKAIKSVHKEKRDEIYKYICENKSGHKILSKSYLEDKLFIKEIDTHAFIFSKYCLDVINLLNDVYDIKFKSQKEMSKKLLTNLSLMLARNKVNVEMTSDGMNYSSQLNRLEEQKEYLLYEIEMLNETISALKGIIECENEWS